MTISGIIPLVCIVLLWSVHPGALLHGCRQPRGSSCRQIPAQHSRRQRTTIKISEKKRIKNIGCLPRHAVQDVRTAIRGIADEVDIGVMDALPPDATQWFSEAVCESTLCAIAVGAGEHDRHPLRPCTRLTVLYLHMHAPPCGCEALVILMRLIWMGLVVYERRICSPAHMHAHTSARARTLVLLAWHEHIRFAFVLMAQQ